MVESYNERSGEITEIVSKIDNNVYSYPFSHNKASILHLNLSLFKTQPCMIKEEHNKIKCPYYHSSKKDFRRNPDDYGYSSFICLYLRKSSFDLIRNNLPFRRTLHFLPQFC